MSEEAPNTSSTRPVYAGREDLRDHGVYAPPLDLSTTDPFRDLVDAAYPARSLQ